MKVGDPKLDAIVKRPMWHLGEASAAWPTFWRAYDRWRLWARQNTPFPNWCYAPSCGVYCCLNPGYVDGSNDTFEDFCYAQMLSTFAAWRSTKGIYLFDKTMFDALWDTPIEGALPVELLHRLPEWCVYIPLPAPRALMFGKGNVQFGASLPDGNRELARGFFARLDYRFDGAVWLIIGACMGETSLRIFPLKLVGDLAASCRDFVRISGVSRICAAEECGDEETAEALRSDLCEQAAGLIRPMVSILLWLCSAEPEIVGLDPLRGLRTKKTKQGERIMAANEPQVYEVAYRIGAALRLAKDAAAHAAAGGSHASPRPHIRRAHWHSYWTGPMASLTKEQPTERKLVLKWVAPIAVCAGTTDDTIIPTIHPVLV